MLKLCQQATTSFPKYSSPVCGELPDLFAKGAGSLNQAIGRIESAMAFARWRKAHEGECKSAFQTIIGQQPAKEELQASSTGKPLYWLLSALNAIVKNAEPLSNALSKVASLVGVVKTRRDREKRMRLYAAAVMAIEPLFDVRACVEKQVASLVTTLSSRTLQWKKDLYVPAFKGAPEVSRTDVRTDGACARLAVVYRCCFSTTCRNCSTVTTGGGSPTASSRCSTRGPS